MNTRTLNWIKIILGIGLVAIGFVLLRGIAASQGILTVLPYICIGVGCGTFGHGMGDILSRKAIASDPTLQEQIKIEQSDERNLAIANRAKGKAFDIMLYVFGALMLSFALMQISLAAILLLVFAYLLVVSCSIYYRIKYEKEM